MAPNVVATVAIITRATRQPSLSQKFWSLRGSLLSHFSHKGPVNRKIPATAAKDSWRDTLAAA